MPQDMIANLEALLAKGTDAPSCASRSRLHLAAGDTARRAARRAAVALDARYSAGWKALGRRSRGRRLIGAAESYGADRGSGSARRPAGREGNAGIPQAPREAFGGARGAADSLRTGPRPQWWPCPEWPPVMIVVLRPLRRREPVGAKPEHPPTTSSVTATVANGNGGSQRGFLPYLSNKV